ncbi:hypothetical protein HOD20_05140 [archaeon]|jgi:hypothetical protein|nr:hypothetical protein [archaeon]MBT4351889.1 hypothetical protein [archaeon]MBT4648419.1 hypothetical protein [archaeon]MBT6821774.1 hypothetical protein [archaeon]MBT7391536.1 hypothetical protein [archaeon]
MIKTIILFSIILVGAISSRKEIKAIFDIANEKEYFDMKKLNTLYKKKNNLL